MRKYGWMLVYIQVLALGTIPVVLLMANIIAISQRVYVLCAVLIIVLVWVMVSKMTLKELGFRRDNIKKSWLPYGVFTVLGVIGLIVFAQLLHKQPLPYWWTNPHLQWLFLPISVMQEFIYRSVGQTKLQKVSSPWIAILTINVLYAGMHVLWRDPLVILMTFIGGIGWGYLWYKYPNFYLLAASHAVLNFAAVYLGFFSWLVTDYFMLK